MKRKRGYYDVFVRTVAKYPANIAVRHYDYGQYKCYTYSELFGACEYIAQNLQQLKCKRGIIGLVSERNILIPCVIAAAHKCNTSFMFLDPSQEIDNIASNLKFQAVINIIREDAPAKEEKLIRKPDRSITVFGYIIGFFHYEPNINKKKQPQNHSFIAMTSGSTGEPKHVQVPVQCIKPNIDDFTKLFTITCDDIIYFSTPLTFDPSMVEILLACMNGASLLIAPDRAEILFPDNKNHSVTVWQTTPSKFFQYPNAHIKNKILSADSTLRILALGGEPLIGLKLIKELKSIENKTKIFTLYGVTEMSCWACAAELDLGKVDTDKEIPLGNCLSETEILVQPEKETNVYTGKIILISKTRKCIVLNKFQGAGAVNSIKFIDTGDLGEVVNGTIYYRGRKDDMVKRFGHKINLQIIESTAMQCPHVKACSCLWLPNPMLLIIYFSSESIGTKELSEFLKCKLDDKHWPDKVIRVENMPTNRHGKVCKKSLSNLCENTGSPTVSLESIRMNFLNELKTTMNCNFTYNDVKDKNFFSLGGTSFLAVSMCNKISLTYPNFGKYIVPYLMSPKYTIDDVMELASNNANINTIKVEKKIKRVASGSLSHRSHSYSYKKIDLGPEDTIEFKVAWMFDTGKCVDSSPTVLETKKNTYVVVSSHSGKVAVLSAFTGYLHGIIKIKARVEASVYCYLEMLTNIPCGVVGAYDGTIICFTLDDCQEKWRINIGNMIKSKATSCNGYIYVASYDGTVQCIDMVRGIALSVIHVADQAVSADLVLAKKEYILACTLSGVCACIKTDSNTIAWRGTVGSPVFASPVLYDNEKYVIFAEVNGDIHCRTVAKGIKVWQFQGAQGNIFSSLCIREIGKQKWQMVFGCHDNKVYSLLVKNSQPCLQWRTQLSAPVYSTPCSLNNKLILAASKNGTLYVLDPEKGVILSEYELSNETFSSPAVFENKIFIGCRDDHMYCLHFSICQ